MELKKLIKNTSYLVSAKIVKFLVGIVIAKLIAVFLGVLGAGIIAQLNMITQKMTRFTLLSMNDGLVKQIAENRDNLQFNTKLPTLIKSYTIVVLGVLIISISLIGVFSKQLTVYILGDIGYYKYFVFGMVSFPILVINSISYAVLKGFKEIRYIARSEIYVILINFIAFIPLVYFYGITGGVIHIGFSFLSILFVNNYFARKKILLPKGITLKNIINAKIDLLSIKELFVFVGFGLTSGMALMVSDVVARSILVTNLGIDKVGVYSPITAWAGLFTGFILASYNTYLYPRFSEEKDNRIIVGILNDVIRLNTFIFIVLLALAIPLRFVLIELLYSADFLDAATYLPWHFIGLLFTVWMYPFGLVFTPKGKIKIYGFFVIIMSAIDVLTVYILVPRFGLYGWMAKFIVSPIFCFVLYSSYHRSFINFSFSTSNKYLMYYALSVPLLIIGIEKYLLSNVFALTGLGTVLILLGLLFTTTSERNAIMRKFKR